MLIELANHNEDIKQLLEEGFALRVDSSYLVVRDIPYLDSSLNRKMGAFVTKLEFIDKVRVKQDNHQVYFAGSAPHGLNGRPIPNLGGGDHKLTLSKTDVVVERSFSNKRKNSNGQLIDFKNFFDKITHYVALISGPAIEKYGGKEPYTYNVDRDIIGESVFKLHDTLTSRAEIGNLTPLLKNDVIAIIGLGGTGSYLLDFLVKSPVKEIRGFDGDFYHIHNSFRSPGQLQEAELGNSKAKIYEKRYENFRIGLTTHQKYITRDSTEDFKGVTFAFVCVDKGSARAEIFELLISLGIPFIDVGMGLNRLRGPIAGTARVTTYTVEKAAEIRDKKLAELEDSPDDEYRTNVQISELNAINAALAILRYKQLRGFYFDEENPYHLLFNVEKLRIFTEGDS